MAMESLRAIICLWNQMMQNKCQAYEYGIWEIRKSC